MTLHPIAVVDHVLEEYRSYLKTEFHARDPQLRQALEEALDQPGFLAQEPFFQAHRPFKEGLRWDQLGLDARLADVMAKRAKAETTYLHQSEAIAHLLGPDPGPLAVTTGTGSGKTECFLLPVIQNAIEDSVRFKKGGITAILVYPMNALANDQEERINQLLEQSGHTHVTVKRYDRSTKQDERQTMRRNPPHILLTNYMMLEYLLVRAADREDLFANHRCRFVVLDEVHTYRGALGANIALLFRRLQAHLKRARHDWLFNDRTDPKRFPEPITVATSATIKSIEEGGKTPAEVRQLRDESVQQFLGTLTGIEAGRFKVLGEEIKDLVVPAVAAWPSPPVAIDPPDPHDAAWVHATLAMLAGTPGSTSPLAELAARTAILWKLGDLLARKPMSVGQIVEEIRADVSERNGAEAEAVRREVQAALVVGAALPDDVAGALRLKTHRFIRGGWRFRRCVDPECGRLYPRDEQECECGALTAPLYVCRNCGADVLRFRETSSDGPEASGLRPNAERGDDGEWVLYDRARFSEAAADEEGLVGLERQMRERPVMTGSFDPATCSFSTNETTYTLPVALAPARTRCLVCGGSAGARPVLTEVSLGTSAAVRVLAEGLTEALAEENKDRPGHDGKERLLIFADSRQDAAHQARFITYAGRYDRMRRRLANLLADAGQSLTIEDAVQRLMAAGVERHDNPQADRYFDADYLPPAVQARAKAWEEAPLLDDLAVSAGYRATVFNLGLVGVRYQHLGTYVDKAGERLAAELGVNQRQLQHICQCLLDEMRRRGALSRPMLRFHTSSPTCPDEFKAPADWERRIKQPNGYVCDEDGRIELYLDQSCVPEGIRPSNFWRRPGAGGRGPSLERKLRHLLRRLGGADPTEEHMEALLELLSGGPKFVVPVKLFGFRRARTLLQVNADNALLELLDETSRYKCSVCNERVPWATEGLPCPSCHGIMQTVPDAELQANRYVLRIRRPQFRPLVAGEHTAQVTGAARIELEQAFKAIPERSPVNVLACSPTLEMGIDVGGLDAVVMRNIPPRPDNYAQRGGRSGRRTRVGIVVGYARSTPHDGYFFDKPREMIAGEVPAPSVGLTNRDVLRRHLNAILFGTTNPPLAGRMSEYLDNQGALKPEAIEALLAGLTSHIPVASAIAWEALGPSLMAQAGLGSVEDLKSEYEQLPGAIEDLLDRTRLQIIRLRDAISRWNELLQGGRQALQAASLINRLLGISDRDASQGAEADDRSAGHPMRRFAEFGILPGYEFPNEPCTLRLLGDDNEDETVAVERRFGIGQYQPGAPVHARGHRWRVVGLDLASPWNPKTTEPSWIYAKCANCELRYDAQEPRCPRCGSTQLGCPDSGLAGYEFGGFVAVRSDSPVLEEEDRYAAGSLVFCHPQHDGEVRARYRLRNGWRLQLRAGEEVRWVNEWRPPSEADEGRPQLLPGERRGFYICPSCGRDLAVPDGSNTESRGRRRASRGDHGDPFGHAQGCDRKGQPPRPVAIVTRTLASTLRLLVDLPQDLVESDYLIWGHSLAAALRAGMRHLYMLDGSEVDAQLESPWTERKNSRSRCVGAVTFIDVAVGGTGFLDRAAREFHLISQRAIDHLEHPNCQTACYRCLKAYQNQRHHNLLSWPRVIEDLKELSFAAPSVLGRELDDHADPTPWLDAYDAGVGSPLELRFLRLFESQGFDVEKQVPISANDGEAPISIADFVLKGTKIAIYVDGAAFHQGKYLRRDRFIRDRLRQGNLAWQIVELVAADLANENRVVERLRAGA